MTTDTGNAGEPEPFRYDREVPPGETQHLRYEVSETYLGDPVDIPVTVVNGERDGPRVCMTPPFTATSSTA